MSAILSALPVAIWIIPIIFAVFAALVWYALFWKDDVSAFFQHGKTMFRIEAKGRRHRT